MAKHQDSDQDPFLDTDINLIEAIASQTAIAIVKTKLNDDLKNLL